MKILSTLNLESNFDNQDFNEIKWNDYLRSYRKD